MKLYFKTVLILSIILISLSSCSTDNNSNPQKLLKSLVEVSTDGSTTTTQFYYSGSKISSAESEQFRTEFTYTDDLITKIVSFNKESNHQTTFVYLYSNGVLTKLTSSDNYEIQYTYNNDGTVNYIKYLTNNNSNPSVVYHGVLTFKNENLTKDKRISNTAGSDVLSQKTTTMDYDNKRNPLHNIVGYSKLLDGFKTISMNNIANTLEESSIKYISTDQIVSSAKNYTSTYKYDSDGYPIEITSERGFFYSDNTNHLKSLLYY
jgi:hypothetical protein